MGAHDLSAVNTIRRALATAIGVTPPRRRDVLRQMLFKPSDERALYWLELLFSMGIATFGLVLDSTGIVIGAMLVSPLMTPIVELSMALTVMSAYLLVQALLRVIVSILVVTLGAAAITVVLPFQEATGEILARTSPTVLDLFAAIGCALAAALITVRPHAGATSTAAGTAIGISLVPPLCVAGFGLGSGNRVIAEGALLLFVANFCAILVFASLFFWLVGFRPVRAGTSEGRTATGPIDSVELALARVVETRLGGRHGAYMRVLLPGLLLLIVIVPLAQALSEVSREVRARAAVNRLIQAEPLLADALQIDQTIDRGALRLRAIVVGTDEQALELEQRLALSLTAAIGTQPLVHVRAVPEASAFGRAASESRQRDPIDLVSPREAADKVSREIRSALARHWPPSAGPMLDTRVELASDGRIVVTLATGGAALDATAEAILAQTLTGDLGTRVRIRSVGFPVEPRTAPVADHDAWLAAVSEPMIVARSMPAVAVCLGLPTETDLRRLPGARRTRETVLSWANALPAERVDVADAPTWRVRFARGSCAEPAPAASDTSSGP